MLGRAIDLKQQEAFKLHEATHAWPAHLPQRAVAAMQAQEGSHTKTVIAKATKMIWFMLEQHIAARTLHNWQGRGMPLLYGDDALEFQYCGCSCNSGGHQMRALKHTAISYYPGLFESATEGIPLEMFYAQTTTAPWRLGWLAHERTKEVLSTQVSCNIKQI